MTRINAAPSFNEVILKGAITYDTFTGRGITALSGYDVDATRRRGYRRDLSGEASVRPGAYSPRTTRTRFEPGKPAHVGTTSVVNALEDMRAGIASRGFAGSRSSWERSRAKKAGIDSQVSLYRTPAYAVIETAMARTGGAPVLASRFTSLPGESPAGMTRFDPVPGYTRVPLGDIVPAQSPVGCLPGTPGCYAGDATGARTSWQFAQAMGRAMMTSPVGSSPLPHPASRTASPLGAPSESVTIRFPVPHPGTEHSVASDGGPSYVSSPGYPRYSSPFGYKGAARTGAETDPRGPELSRYEALVRQTGEPRWDATSIAGVALLALAARHLLKKRAG